MLGGWRRWLPEWLPGLNVPGVAWLGKWRPEATVVSRPRLLGGTIEISAVFGDDHYVLRGTVTEAA